MALCGLTSWLRILAYQQHQQLQQRALFLEIARQGAVNLTTIDWQHADSDIQRILDSSTGSFREQFERRSDALIDVVKRAQSKSQGAVREAGIESVIGQLCPRRRWCR